VSLRYVNFTFTLQRNSWKICIGFPDKAKSRVIGRQKATGLKKEDGRAAEG
jgi:hypothetical protein